VRDAIIVEPARRTADSSVATVRIGRTSQDVSFRLRGIAPSPLDDPFLPPALLLGMRLRRPVRVEGPVSKTLLASIPVVVENLLAWYPALRGVEVTAPAPVEPPPAHAGGVACFFSAGLDSFYSALRPPRDVTHLIFVRGFDIRLEDRALREAVAQRVRDASTELGTTLVEAETDLRRWSDPHADWTWYCHAGLVAVALLAGHALEEVRIPATIADAHRPAALRGPRRGTWNDGLARIVSDGAEATRPQKARVVAECEAARRSLRVCWENREGRYNCLACPKCLRTMVALEVVGVRDRFDDFRGPLDLAAVARLAPRRGSDRRMIEECLWETEGHPHLEPVAAALRTALAQGTRGRWRSWLGTATRLGRPHRRRAS
jgi:hypothetical protein